MCIRFGAYLFELGLFFTRVTLVWFFLYIIYSYLALVLIIVHIVCSFMKIN